MAALDEIAAEVAKEVAAERIRPMKELWVKILRLRKEYPWWVRWDIPSLSPFDRRYEYYFGEGHRDLAPRRLLRDSLYKFNQLKKEHTMIDVKAAQEEAEKEVRAEAVRAAKDKIKAKLKAIAAAEAVTANLKREYAVLLREIGA